MEARGPPRAAITLGVEGSSARESAWFSQATGEREREMLALPFDFPIASFHKIKTFKVCCAATC